MYRLIVFVLLLTLAFASCSKSNNPGDDTPPVVPPKPDTLSAGWSKIVAGSRDEAFTDVFFTDALNGYSCSQFGVYRSINGGITWQNIYWGSNFANIAASGNNAVFVNDTDTIYTTQNRGGTIQKRKYTSSNPGALISFDDAFFNSSQTCVATSALYVWKSLDGGQNFDSVYKFSNQTPYLNAIFFINDQQGWIARGTALYRTINSGSSWQVVTSPLLGGYNSVSFSSASVGFVSENEKLYKTIDGGLTWQMVFSGAPDRPYTDIAIISDQIIYIGSGNKIYRTTDGGAQWTAVAALGEGVIIELHFIDANHGWASTSGGTILRFN